MMPYKSFSYYLKNQILKDDIDLSSLDSKELYYWLISNFTTILSDQKIFINSITLTLLKAESYKILYLIEAIGDDKVFKIEYGEFINTDFLDKYLVQNNVSRLSLLNFDSNEINLNKLNSSDSIDYTLIKSKKRKTLIIY
tara:strand:+ start:1758 stop:2177 length:420 start_codon:yes stop_codon:yes gene_type:complete